MLTFEKIRELERVERDGKKLQNLPDDIMNQLCDYLRRKEKTKDKSSADLMELENVKNTIRRFFEFRERKLLTSVLDTIRTGLPPENLTREEEKVFYELVFSLKHFREAFFEELQKEPGQEKPVYKVKKTIPEFVGPDMKTYKLTENELVELPKELEELLLKEGVVEKSKEKIE